MVQINDVTSQPPGGVSNGQGKTATTGLGSTSPVFDSLLDPSSLRWINSINNPNQDMPETMPFYRPPWRPWNMFQQIFQQVFNFINNFIQMIFQFMFQPLNWFIPPPDLDGGPTPLKGADNANAASGQTEQSEARN